VTFSDIYSAPHTGSFVTLRASWLPAIVLMAVALVCPAAAQQPSLAVPQTSAGADRAPRVPPRPGFVLHDEGVTGGFVVQRWVDPASPDVSPAGMCACLTVVYQGTRLVLTLGQADDLTAVSVVPPTGRDVNGDRQPDVVVSAWSGGAHCCYTTSVYSIGTTARPLLTLESGDCGTGPFEDFDGDGLLEVTTCDPVWGYQYCAFAFSPLPPVVYAYDAGQGRYRPATPRFAARFRGEIDTSLADARAHFAAADRETMLDKCTALRPALQMMYTGRVDEGRALLRSLYRGADAAAFEADVMARLQASPMWTAR
jgi:hypothetical protein